MARKKNNNKTKKIILISIILLVVLLVALLLLMLLRKPNKMSQEEIEKVDLKHIEEQNNLEAEDLSGKSEQQRMEAYCSKFFRLVDRGNYEQAYELLYDDYKENYFPTLNNFKKYFEDYFPSDFGLSYENIERLGDIYVLMVNVSDVVNGSYGHNFDLYVVLQEKEINNFVISFSRNSAVEEEG